MIFTYRKWTRFCKNLQDKGFVSIVAKDVSKECIDYLVLKHDVETNVKSAYKMALIENKFSHKGVYYVQAYLLNNKNNVVLLKKMQEMGHEISYHYDVMDSNNGNLKRAVLEFDKNVKKFEENGFVIKTVCQHGNPVIERIGYTSNRDFFRSGEVQKLYRNLSDIMVDYKDKYSTEYNYYSDSGRKFKLIFDPINNDIMNSDDKNITYDTLDELLQHLSHKIGNIISVHPHRWMRSAFLGFIKLIIFRVVKTVANVFIKIPFMKRIMSRYYYLAKKI